MKVWHLQAAAAAAVLAALWYASRKVGQGALNPASSNNIVNQGVNAIGQALDLEAGRNADGSWTLGGAIYDWTHPGWADLNKPAPVQATPEAYLYGSPINSSTWGA